MKLPFARATEAIFRLNVVVAIERLKYVVREKVMPVGTLRHCNFMSPLCGEREIEQLLR
jgi:hypothetical protein